MSKLGEEESTELRRRLVVIPYFHYYLEYARRH